MAHLNVEIKARCQNPDFVRQQLLDHAADFKGIDTQIDTYFNIPDGRLKLRQGNIEKSLIFYNRPDQPGPKDSLVSLYKPKQTAPLKQVLTNALGVRVTVTKKREIYFIENVKFHIDQVEHLGHFVEIEAIDESGDIGKQKLLEQCNSYMKLLNITDSDLLESSYSDMLLTSHKI